MELESRLTSFEQRLDEPGAHHDFADGRLARRIAQGCRSLLAEIENHAPERLRLLQSVVEYLLLADDAESDTRSLLGFDDDAGVFDAITCALGRPDLAVGDQRV